MGGSAAALVGGAVAANDLFGGQIAAPDLLNIVCELDGHPDNAAPALLGGLVIGTLTPVGVSAVRLEPKNLKVVVAVPDFAVSTTAARRALPDSVPHRDAAFNVGRSGLLLGALATGEYHLLRVAMQDRLHQPYRSHLIPGLEDVIEVALETGAYGACLSGSGPTVLAFAPEREPERSPSDETPSRRGVSWQSPGRSTWTSPEPASSRRKMSPHRVPCQSFRSDYCGNFFFFFSPPI